jgi:hypothetical protein
MSSDSNDNRLGVLIQAITNDDVQAIEQWVMEGRFFCIGLDDQDESVSALIVETEEFPALVAFTSADSAKAFAESIVDEVEDEMVQLEVDGQSLIQLMSDELGLLINPESEDEVMLEPGLLGTEEEPADE